MNSATPQLSVILTTRTDSESLRLVLRCLRAQTVAPALECLLVTHSSAQLGSLPEERAGVRVMQLPSATSEGAAKAAGVHAAQAPLVAFTEDHCYPHAGWAEALLSAHREGDYAAVGPVVGNANPQTSASWAGFLAFYSPFAAAPPGCDVEHLPGNQSCFRRELLLGYGARLAAMLEAESVLHWDLRARGLRLRQAPAARVYHLNYARLVPLLDEAHWASRAFAAQRAAGWRSGRRALYALGSPLLPAVRLRRILADAGRAGIQGAAWRALPPLALTLGASAWGEMLGYALGEAGAAERIFASIERPQASLTPEVVEYVARICHAA